MSQWDRPPREGKDGKPIPPAPSKDPKANLGEAVEVKWRIDTWFPDMPEDTRKKLKQFHDELLKFNKGVNLISVKTIPQADAIHFADCILASKIIAGSAVVDELYDFGSGNGFPGIVFSLLYPKVKVHLVEVDQRKAEFMKHCITALGLANTDVLIRAIDSLPANSVKYAVSRGFASITKALLGTRKVLAKGGKYYHMKSEEWASEVAQIPTQLCSYWAPALVGDYKLPVGEIRFAVVKTEKIAD